MVTRILLTLLLSGLLGGCGGKSGYRSDIKDAYDAMAPAPGEPHQISLIRLISRPEYYDHGTVRTTGYFNWNDDTPGLFIHKADHDVFITKNAVSIEAEDPALRQWLSLFHGHYMTVMGVFDISPSDVLYSGTIRPASVFEHCDQSGVMPEQAGYAAWRNGQWEFGTLGTVGITSPSTHERATDRDNQSEHEE